MELSTLSPYSLSKGLFRLAFNAMGTQCEITYAAQSTKQATDFREEILPWVKQFEQRYSRYQPDSLISQINQMAGIDFVTLNQEDTRLFELCDTLHFITQGLFDPTTLPLAKLWDFKAKHPTIPEDDKIKAALQTVGWKKVVREENRVFLPIKGMGLDFGGFGKEYAVDRIIEKAQDHKIENILVNFGGDIRTLGSPHSTSSWRIGVEDPSQPGQARVTLSASNRAVATSGNYQRFFTHKNRRYSHLLNHRTGYPASNRLTSSTVTANTCLEAGILATCSLIEGKKEGLSLIENFFGAEGCIFTDSGMIWTKKFNEYTITNET